MPTEKKPYREPLHTPWLPAAPIPLPEYPRPQQTRPQWLNLNGWWQCAIIPATQSEPDSYPDKILVPYPVESTLSGVTRPLLPDQRLWYRRTFSIPESWEDRPVLLHFGAVDYECDVLLNGTQLGSHQGGYLPFTFEISAALQPGENELVVAVRDPSDKGCQQRGKQVLQPRGIWYTAISGIWQTVWLEPVPASSIDTLKLTPDLDGEMLSVTISIRGSMEDVTLAVEILSAETIITTVSGPAGKPLECPLPDPRPWSPSDPFLYDLRVRLIRDGQVLDEVGSYVAMRKFSLERDAAGRLHFALNNKALFLYGPLDQGYFPDGLYTPPSEEAMLFDIDYTRAIGCNMIRKHIKVEPLRWYYHCDRLGMIVWQDMPNGGKIDGEVVATLSMMLGFHRNDTRRLARFGRADTANRAEYRAELQQLIDHLHNAACIAVWVPFNESWGQFMSTEIGDWLRSYDPTRLVDYASGWFDQGGGDFQSKHVYVKKLRRPKADQRAFVLSEFGGYSLKIPGHLWDPDKKFGYRFYKSRATLMEAYQSLLQNQLKPLIPQGLAAAIYTQTTDVEIEINGYLTYDRRVEKMDAEILRRVHQELYACFDDLFGGFLLPPE